MAKLIEIGTKIIGVGRNYAAHAKELGNAVPKEPVLFLKPTSSYLANGGTIEIPPPSLSLHHEVELAVVIGKRARDVPQSKAMDYVGGYALALDMTARDLQSAAKAAGLPWTLAKGQDTFTPISSMLPTSAVPDPDNLELWLKVDGEIRQKGSTKDMIFRIPFLISHISTFMTLFEGDVILTGTPEGVGPVKAGQKITCGITGLVDDVHFNVEQRKRPGLKMELRKRRRTSESQAPGVNDSTSGSDEDWSGTEGGATTGEDPKAARRRDSACRMLRMRPQGMENGIRLPAYLDCRRGWRRTARNFRQSLQRRLVGRCSALQRRRLSEELIAPHPRKVVPPWKRMRSPSVSGFDCGVFLMVYMYALALQGGSMCFTEKDIRKLRHKCLADILRGTIRNFPPAPNS